MGPPAESRQSVMRTFLGGFPVVDGHMGMAVQENGNHIEIIFSKLTNQPIILLSYSFYWPDELSMSSCGLVFC